MRVFGILVFLLILAAQLRLSQAQCRVLTDCDGNARWKDLTSGHVGRPGKQGAPGLIGQKGEPGIGVNVTALKEELREPGGPMLYYYTSTLTWDTGKIFCKIFGKNICSFDQICIPKGGSRELIHEVLAGDHWVPVRDEYNEWAEIGDLYDPPCIRHGRYLSWSKPAWGTVAETRPYKGYVYCCDVEPSQEAASQDIKYQYIGRTATYDSSQQHCENQGLRLCYSSEICTGGKPHFGVVSGDRWVAIKDRRNDWLQIGKQPHAPCTQHGTLGGLPAWGTRTDGSLLHHVGFVFCCSKASRR